MSEFNPLVERQDDLLRITLRPHLGVLSLMSLRCVIDLTFLGEVVGVEVLDFGRQLSGGTAPSCLNNGDVRWSYDPEVDAFYVHVSDGPGQVQHADTAIAYLDSDGQLTVLELQNPSIGG